MFDPADRLVVLAVLFGQDTLTVVLLPLVGIQETVDNPAGVFGDVLVVGVIEAVLVLDTLHVHLAPDILETTVHLVVLGQDAFHAVHAGVEVETALLVAGFLELDWVEVPGSLGHGLHFVE